MNIAACESLATKAELQELRDQINQLLGKPVTGLNAINVLQAGTLDNTALAEGLVQDIKIEENLDTGEIKIAMIKGDPGGTTGEKLAQLATQGVKALKAKHLKELRSLYRFAAVTYKIAKSKNKLETLQSSLLEGLLNFIDSNEVAKNIETTLRDKVDVSPQLLNILDKADGSLPVAKQTIDTSAVEVDNSQKKIELLKDALLKQKQEIEDLQNNDYLQDEEIAQVDRELFELERELEEEKLFTRFERVELKREINGLRDSISKQSDRNEKLETIIYDFSVKLAAKEGDLTELFDRYSRLKDEQQTLKEKFTELEEEFQDYVDGGGRITTRKTITTVYSGGGGGVPPGVQDSIANQQNRLIDIFSQLVGSPAKITNPNTGEEIEVTSDNTFYDIVNNQSSFEPIMAGLQTKLPDLSTFGTGEAQVTPEQLDTFGTDLQSKIKGDTELVVGGIISSLIIPRLFNIDEKVKKESVKAASKEAVCELTEADACLKKNIFDPLKNSLDNVGANTAAGFSALNAVMNDQILTKVTATQTFLNTVWSSTAFDKTLNAANTILAFHNATMLSRNLGESVLDTVSLALNALPIDALEGTEIDANEWVKDRAKEFATGLIGEQTYTTIGNSLNSANRILTSAQGVVSAAHGIKNAVQEGQEVIANRVGVLGNTFMEQGLFEDNSYPWMTTQTNFRNPFSGFVQRVENIDNFVNEVNQLVQSGIEVQENVNELFSQTEGALTASQELKKTLDDFNEAKETDEENKEAESASPVIEPEDLAQAETDEPSI